ncbi:reverse transcriptase domain-containing protein [Tanacetum coccineum]
MPPKPMSQAAIERLITKRVNAAVEAGFMKCNPTVFHRHEGAVELSRWFEKTEMVFGISECAEVRKVKFVVATLQGRALTWWNSQVATMGLEAANQIGWTEMRRKEAIHFLLTGIGDEIYSSVDASKSAHEMWIAIERLQQESMESYYSKFYKMMNEMIRNNLTVAMMQVNVWFLQQLQLEWSRFVTIIKQQHDLNTVSYHKLFDVLKQYQKEVNEIHAERIAKNANPLALVAAAQQYPYHYYQAPKSHKPYAPTSKQSSSTRSNATTKFKGKEIAKPITPPSESASEEDSDPEQAQRDKDMQKSFALIAKYFKKIFKTTNNNLRTSSNFRNKNVDTTPSQVVQQTGIQCFNCKEFGHFTKECRKPKRVKDLLYPKEKMLLCKQAEKGVPLQAELADWVKDTDEEIDEQELEAHYNFMAKIQEVPTADSRIDTEPLEQIILDPDDQPIWESAKTVAPTPNSAIIQLDVDDNFVINNTHLNMIRENKFDCYPRADSHDHNREFLAICDMFRYGETQSEVVKLLTFPFSLCDKAKTWFNELNEESITSWEQMRRDFINRFFPHSLFNCLLLKIRNFSQNVCESLTDAWLRLKSMIQKCHGHGLTKGAIIHIFYHGLDEPTQAILDVTAAGIFLCKSPNQAFQLLEDNVLFEHDWPIKSKNEHHRLSVSFADGSNSNNDNSRLMEKLAALTIKIDSQIISLNEELQDMREKYNEHRNGNASKNNMNDENSMCKRHEANYIQSEGYQNRDSHDSYSRQSHHDPNDSEKSLIELNNDVRNNLEDFKRYIHSMRTDHWKLFARDDGKTTGV